MIDQNTKKEAYEPYFREKLHIFSLELIGISILMLICAMFMKMMLHYFAAFIFIIEVVHYRIIILSIIEQNSNKYISDDLTMISISEVVIGEGKFGEDILYKFYPEKLAYEHTAYTSTLKIDVAGNTDQVVGVEKNGVTSESYLYGENDGVYSKTQHSAQLSQITLSSIHRENSYSINTESDLLNWDKETLVSTGKVVIPQYLGNEKITSDYIPNFVEKNENIKTFISDNSYFVDKGNVALLNSSETILYSYASKSSNTEISLDNVTAVVRYAFYNAKNLEQINNLNNLTSIGDFAFSGTDALETLQLPSLKAINTYTFKGSSITTLGSLEKITSIGDNAFNGLPVETLNNVKSLSTITSLAFNNSVVKTITELDSLYLIQNNAFENNTKIEVLSSNNNTNTLAVSSSAFSGASKLTTLPSYKLNVSAYSFDGTGEFKKDVNIVSIDGYKVAAFRNSGITKATIGSGSTVAESMFEGCSNLKISTSELYSVVTVNKNAFKGCSNIDSFSLPNLTNAQDMAFANCSMISSFYAPKLTSVGKNILSCNGTKPFGLISITIPLVQHISKYFDDYDKIENKTATIAGVSISNNSDVSYYYNIDSSSQIETQGILYYPGRGHTYQSYINKDANIKLSGTNNIIGSLEYKNESCAYHSANTTSIWGWNLMKEIKYSFANPIDYSNLNIKVSNEARAYVLAGTIINTLDTTNTSCSISDYAFAYCGIYKTSVTSLGDITLFYTNNTTSENIYNTPLKCGKTEAIYYYTASNNIISILNSSSNHNVFYGSGAYFGGYVYLPVNFMWNDYYDANGQNYIGYGKTGGNDIALYNSNNIQQSSNYKRYIGGIQGLPNKQNFYYLLDLAGYNPAVDKAGGNPIEQGKQAFENAVYVSTYS